ncbi:MAG: 3-mercaptopyruvate sulfurtransferase [Pseudomonadota bacterium]
MNDPIVSPSWLKDQLQAPDLRVIDATWFGPWVTRPETAFQSYERAHIPGAVFFDIDEIADTDAGLPHMLPDAVKFSSRVRRLGLGDGHRLVVYDANNFFASARVWWMFRAMGHEEIFVLDGGFSGWTAMGGQVEDLPPIPVERHYTARRRADLIKDAAQTFAAAAGAGQVLDARPAARFSGAAPEPREDLASGHMPGSLNVPADSLVNTDGHLKSEAELRSVFEAAGASTTADTIASCGSGVSAAVLALALARLGNWNVAVYDGSWADWASDKSRPIETNT